jgi:hydrogenase expression/formation protein HypC
MCLGIPGRIVEMREDEGLPMGIVDFGGARREVCLAFVADRARVGDYAVVHVGFAISLVDEEEALRTYQLLDEMGELEELKEPADSARPGTAQAASNRPGPAGPEAPDEVEQG